MSDFGEESGGGPDADSWHAGQDRPKRVCMHQPFHFAGNLVALLAQGGELLGEAWLTMVAAWVPGTTTACSLSS